MRRILLIAAGASVALMGCEAIDLAKLRLGDGGVEATCVQLDPVGCFKRAAPTDVCRSRSGAWTLVVPAGAQHRAVVVRDRGPKEAAAAIDWASGTGDLAGFVVSLPRVARSIARTEARRIAARLAAVNVFKSTTLRLPGASVRTHDGHDAIIGSEVEIELRSSAELHWVRNHLYPLLLGGDLARFGSPPTLKQEGGVTFILTFATIVRHAEGRVIVSGGVSTANSYRSPFSLSRVRAGHLADATLLGSAAATPRPECRELRFSSLGAADLLWLVDESEQMAGRRTNVLHKGGDSVFCHAQRLGLGLRIGVVGMGQTSTSGLCGGRFWNVSADADLTGLQRCLLRPSREGDPCFAPVASPPSPFFEHGVGAEECMPRRGLSRARRTLLGMLPRASGAARLGPGHETALLFSSNAAPASVATLFDDQPPAGPLTAQETTKLTGHLAPYVDLLRGVRNPANVYPDRSHASHLAGTVAYALLGDPTAPASCRGARGTGYIELVDALGGWRRSICDPVEEITGSLERLVEEIAARASHLTLASIPVSSTLVVVLNDELVPPSLEGGYVYSGLGNTLLLHGEKSSLDRCQPRRVERQNRMSVRYLRW